MYSKTLFLACFRNKKFKLSNNQFSREVKADIQRLYNKQLPTILFFPLKNRKDDRIYFIDLVIPFMINKVN